MTEPTAVTIGRPPDRRSKPSSHRARPAATVSASALALHLDCSRAYLTKLECEGVLRRDGGGFDLDASRLAYIRHLRRERQQSPRSEADAAFQRAKTRMLELKIAKQEHVLMMTDEAMDMVETLIGQFRTGLGSLPARIAGRDLQKRRLIESYCNEILQGIADEANRQAAELERELGITENDYPTPP